MLNYGGNFVLYVIDKSVIFIYVWILLSYYVASCGWNMGMDIGGKDRVELEVTEKEYY